MWLFNKKAKSQNTFEAYYTRVEGTLLAMEAGHPSDMWPSVKQQLLNMVQQDKTKAMNLFSNLEIPVEQWTKQCVFNISSNLVESGNFHIYRGVLSPQGQELYSIYRYASDQLVKEGAITQEWADNDAAVLLEHIDEVG